MDNKPGSNKVMIKRSIRLALTISFVMMIISTVGLTGYLPSANGLIAVNDTGKQLFSSDLKTIVVVSGAPYTFMNAEGQPDGFSVDLMRAVGQVMGFNIQSRADIWDNARQALENGEIDFLPLVAYSEERGKVFDFTPPHTIAYDAFFTRKDTSVIRSMDDLEGKTIIVLKGDQAHNYLLSNASVKKEQLIPVDTLPEGLRLLASGKGDTAIMPKLVGLMFIKDLNLTNIDQSPVVVEAYNRPFCFAVKKGNKQVLERLNQGLIIVKNTGQYDEIYQKWFGTLEPQGLSTATVLKYLGGIILFFSLIGAILLLWSFSLRKQVALRTRFLDMEIQERKQMEVSLRESEEKFRALFESATDGIFLLSSSGEIVSLNASFARMHGYTVEEMLSMNLKVLDTPESAQQAPARLQRLFSGEALSFEVEHYCKNGQIIPLEASANLVLIGDKKYILGFHRDITQRKLAEEELKKHRDHLEELVKERTAQLNQKNEELERFNRLFVGRELRMIELKKRNTELEKEIGNIKITCEKPE